MIMDKSKVFWPILTILNGLIIFFGLKRCLVFSNVIDYSALQSVASVNLLKERMRMIKKFVECLET